MRIVCLEEIRACLDLATAVSAIRRGFIGYSAGEVELGAVGHLHFPEVDGDCHIKSAAMVGSDVFVVKVATGFPQNPAVGLKASDGMMVVLDTRTGAPLGLFLDEGHLTDLRTAIAGALAATLIRPVDCDSIGIVGTGIQGRLQAELAAQLIGIDRVVVWGRDGAKAAQMAADLGPVSNFVREADFRHQMTNLSPKITANWVFASVHSRGGRFHSWAA